MFMDFLTTPTSATHAKLEEQAKQAEEARIERIRQQKIQAEKKKVEDEKNAREAALEEAKSLASPTPVPKNAE